MCKSPLFTHLTFVQSVISLPRETPTSLRAAKNQCCCGNDSVIWARISVPGGSGELQKPQVRLCLSSSSACSRVFAMMNFSAVVPLLQLGHRNAYFAKKLLALGIYTPVCDPSLNIAGRLHGNDLEDWLRTESELLRPVSVEVAQG